MNGPNDHQPAPPGTVKPGDGKWIALAAVVYFALICGGACFGYTHPGFNRSIPILREIFR